MRSNPWLLVDELPPTSGATVILDPAESRHAAGPLRLRRDDPVTLADGSGRVAKALLRSVSGHKCSAEITEITAIGPAVDRKITLALGVLHSQAMDWAVQKSVEIGVSAVIPVLTARSQLGAKASEGRLEHWRRVARQALKQCHRPWQMEVENPHTLDELMGLCGDRPGVVADPGGRFPSELGHQGPDVLLVGPEGGLTTDETDRLGAAGWDRLRLGPHVLRADTAAVIGASILVAAHETMAVGSRQ